MSWLATKLFIQKSWLFIKEHWKIFALGVWSVFIWVISRRNSKAAIDAMVASRKSYEARIKSLKEQHIIEVKKREELHLKYQETLDKIEKKYKKKEKELSVLEKKKIKEIVKKAKDEPNEINEKIEALFGFTSDS